MSIIQSAERKGKHQNVLGLLFRVPVGDDLTVDFDWQIRLRGQVLEPFRDEERAAGIVSEPERIRNRRHKCNSTGEVKTTGGVKNPGEVKKWREVNEKLVKNGNRQVRRRMMMTIEGVQFARRPNRNGSYADRYRRSGGVGCHFIRRRLPKASFLGENELGSVFLRGRNRRD